MVSGENPKRFSLSPYCFAVFLFANDAGRAGKSILSFCRANTRRVWIFEFGIEIRLDPRHRDSLRRPTARNSDLPLPTILAYAVEAMGKPLVVMEAGNSGPRKLD